MIGGTPSVAKRQSTATIRSWRSDGLVDGRRVAVIAGRSTETYVDRPSALIYARTTLRVVDGLPHWLQQDPTGHKGSDVPQACAAGAIFSTVGAGVVGFGNGTIGYID